MELRLPVVVVVLRGYDDDHGEDGAQHNGGDADGQADEGEVACLAGGYLRRHHVSSGYRRAHLSDGRRRGCGRERRLEYKLRNEKVHEWEQERVYERIDFTAAPAECAQRGHTTQR